MTFPGSLISIAVWEPRARQSVAKIDNGLAKLAEEDPTFTVSYQMSTMVRRLSQVWSEVHTWILSHRPFEA